jgi:hypothetical protein
MLELTVERINVVAADGSRRIVLANQERKLPERPAPVAHLLS